MEENECFDEYDNAAKIYQVNFVVYGTDAKNVKHIILEEEDIYVIAIDVVDVVNQIKKDYLNSEFNFKTDTGLYHSIGQDIRIDSAKLVGVLAGISDASRKLFKLHLDDIEGD